VTEPRTCRRSRKATTNRTASILVATNYIVD
jgi:hypothetical protein